MTRKKSWGAHARWCAIAIFQLTELNIKANPPCFAGARAHVRALMTQKSCAVEMRNAILRNYLKGLLQFVRDSGACATTGRSEIHQGTPGEFQILTRR